MKKLISAKEYIILVWEMAGLTYIQKLHLLVAYANFLSQPLTLGMFVPCKLVGGVWVVLEDPVNYSAFEVGMSRKDFNFCFPDCQEYQEAKDRVLFEGFEKIITNNSGSFEIMRDGFQVYYYKSIPDYCLWLGSQKEKLVEDLVKHNLELTQTAQKQLSSIIHHHHLTVKYFRLVGAQ